MKRSSGTIASLRILACAVVIVTTFGYFGHVKAQDGTGTPGQMIVPLRPLAPLSSVAVPPVFGMEGILSDRNAAARLGKALFWDMQAGSDDIQAGATCHFNAGADSRAINNVNPGQAGGDNSFQIGVPFNGTLGPNYHYSAGNPGAGFGGYHDGDFPFHKLSDPNDRNSSVISDVNDVSGSQGVFATSMGQVILGEVDKDGNLVSGNGQGGQGQNQGDGDDGRGKNFGPGANNSRRPVRSGSTFSTKQGSGKNAGGSQVGRSDNFTSVETGTSVPDPVFSYPNPDTAGQLINTRKVTGRNTPSAVNAVFNYRNFWDGRAQNTCNGSNPFGARDKNSHLLIGDPTDGNLGPAFVSMQNSALCSQALGPILSSVEMSADGRD